MNSLNFLYTIYFFSIFIHIISSLIVLFFVLPLQFKEARVRNGLRSLRLQLLAFGSTVFILGAVSTITLSLRFFIDGEFARYMTVLLVLFHALGFLAFSLIGWKMYTHQYSEEGKKLHEKFADVKGLP